MKKVAAVRMSNISKSFGNVQALDNVDLELTGAKAGNLKIFGVLVSIPISLVGIFLGPILIEEFFPQYIGTVDAIQIMSLVIVPTIIALIFESQFLGSEKSRVVLIGNAISTVILISGMIVLGLNFGIIGLAWSLVLATSTKTIFFLFAYYKDKITKPKIK